jgi:flagellar biosynthesis/type III secretory pathway M-ring protein FliF/YscJ
MFLNALGYVLLVALAALFFYVDVFFAGVACALLLVFFALSDFLSRRRRRAAAFAAARARAAAQAAEEEEEEEDDEEYEEEKILIRHKVGAIPKTMHLRIKPKSKRRNTWEMTMQSTGDVMDSVFGSLYRLAAGKHEHEGRKPWQAGRGR